MPELPEVETVIRSLSKKVEGLTFESSNLMFGKILKHGDLSNINDKRIEGLHRRGKFIIFALADGFNMVVHLRMEGKLFYYDEKIEPNKHTTCVFNFKTGSQLHFIDVRKFGCLYVYRPDEQLECLSSLGYEANRLTPSQVRSLLDENKDVPLKELLLDQTKIAGIGNIYADEIAFRLKTNPFANVSYIEREGIEDEFASASNSILNKAIENNGSTIKSFLVSQGTHGNNQDNLKVYGRQGKECLECGNLIQKRDFNGRGTSYCPKCQNVPMVIGITGGMASGKSTFSKFFSDELNYRIIDCDKLVFDIYADKNLSKHLRLSFPQVFNDSGIDKKKLTILLITDMKKRKSFLTKLYSILKEVIINRYLNKYPTDGFIIEAPLLFDAHIDYLCTKIVMMRTSNVEEHLKSRGEKDITSRLRLANTNNWQRYLDRCDYIVNTNDSIEDLKEKMKEIAKVIKENAC